MALISESVGIFNEGYFHRVRRELMSLYGTDDYLSSNSLPTPLLTEFNVWCESFRSRIVVQKKAGVKYDKRKHQRFFMQWSTMLACLAHLCQDSVNAYATFREVFDLPAVLRLYHVLKVAYDSSRVQRAEHVKPILKLYNDGLVSLAQSGDEASPSHDAATVCTEMMPTEFEKLQTVILQDAEPRLKKSYGTVAIH